MTIEDLLPAPPDVLEKLSDAELTAILSPYFNVTRPDLALLESHKGPVSNTRKAREANANLTEAQKILQAQGLGDLSGMLGDLFKKKV